MRLTLTQVEKSLQFSDRSENENKRNTLEHNSTEHENSAVVNEYTLWVGERNE